MVLNFAAANFALSDEQLCSLSSWVQQFEPSQEPPEHLPAGHGLPPGGSGFGGEQPLASFDPMLI
jgi:hypothetical protein